MNFNSGGGNQDILRSEPVGIGVTNFTDLAWQNRARIENPPERYEMFLAPNEGCVICLNGVEYVSRRDAQFGFIWELPCRAVNEFIQLKKVILGGKKDENWIQLTLRAVRYPQPTS